MIAFLFSKAGGYLAAIGAVLVAIATFGASQRIKGRKEARDKAEDADFEHAEDIRKRVSDNRNDPERLRKFDGAGFRD